MGAVLNPPATVRYSWIPMPQGAFREYRYYPINVVPTLCSAPVSALEVVRPLALHFPKQIRTEM
jgi:hypothetical protein